MNAFFHRRPVLLRDNSADDLVEELKMLAPGQRLHLNGAITELTATAGLFFVFALDRGLALQCLAVGNTRGAQFHLDTEFPS